MRGSDNLNKYIPLQEATKFCNYSQEYLSLRARQGKLKAVKFGRNWVTKQEWLVEYLSQVEEYNETYENSKVKKLGVVPDNLPIELIGWQKIRLPNFSKMPVSGLRSGFVAALAVSLLLNNIAFGKENFKNVFQEADNHVAQLGAASNKLLVNSKESIETVFGAANSLTASADLGSIFNTIIANIVEADTYTYIKDRTDSLLADSKESFENVFASLDYLVAGFGLRTERSLAESDRIIGNVFEDASLYAYMSGSGADKFWADAGESLKNIFEDSTSFVNGFGENFDKGLANNFGNLTKKADNYTYIITASLGDILADSASGIKDVGTIASSFVANLGNGFDKKLASIAGGWQDSFASVYDDLKKINLGLADAGNAVGKKTGENLIGYFSRLKDGYISTNEFVEEKISQGLKSAKKSVLDFGSKISNIGKFTVSPWKEGVVPDQVAVEEKAKEEDVKKLEKQIEELKATPAKEIVKEVTRVTQVEPVKEITREVTRVDEFALTQVRAQIVDLQDAVAKRLYAPGGVVSQQIYITQPVSSPKVYQENGDIILQTLGSGNVVLTAATGLQISGKQIVIDSTAVSNPLVYIADKTDIAGDTSVGGTVTSQKIVINSGNSGENILDVKYNSVSKFSVTDTSSSLVGNFTITGSLTANGDQAFNGILSLSTSSASAILTVAQSGSGKIVDFKDGSVSVFTIADGGYADLAVSASTTPAFLIRMAEATSTFSTSTYLGVLATSTFVGRFADFVKSGSGSLFYLDSSGNMMATGTLTTGATTTLAVNGGYVGVGTSSPATLFAVATSTNIFNVLTNGNVGIGTASPSSKLYLYDSFTNTGGSSLYVVSSSTVTADSTNYVRGVRFESFNQNISAGVTDSGYRMGILSDTYVENADFAGTLAWQYGIRSDVGIVNASPSAIVSNAYAGNFRVLNRIANATITNAYGVYIENSEATGAITNRYDLYASSANAKNYFAGLVGIATTTPDEKLTVWGGAFFGTSTAPTLYIASSTGRVGVGTSTPATLFTVATSTDIFSVTTGGRVGIGTSAPTAALEINGNLTFSGNATITSAAAGNLVFDSGGGSITVASGDDFLAAGSGSDIGSAGTRFSVIYADEVNAATLVGTTTVGNTSAQTLTINSDNATNDTEDIYLAFERGTRTPNALLQWNSTSTLFDFNFGTRITNSTGTDSFVVFDEDSDSSPFVIDRLGNVAIGTSTASENLTVWGGAFFGTSTAPTLYIASSTGRVGVGTSSPSALFTVGTSTDILTVSSAGSGSVTVSSGRLIVNNAAATDQNSITSNPYRLLVDNNEVINMSSNPEFAKTSADYTSVAVSVIGRSILDSSNTKDWTRDLRAGGLNGGEFEIRIEDNSTGTVTRGTGILVKGNGEIGDGAALTNWVGIRIDPPTGSGVTAGNVANVYGLLMDDFSTGGTTNNYAIYSSAGKSYFGGNIGIATTTPDEKLTVWGGAFFGTTSATPTLYIASSTGRVAIGTSTASTLFTIATSTNIFNITTAGGVGVGTTTAGSAWFQVASTSPGLIVDRAGQVGIGTTTLGGLFTVGTSTTGLTVLQNGHVGIGTTTASALFTVGTSTDILTVSSAGSGSVTVSSGRLIVNNAAATDQNSITSNPYRLLVDNNEVLNVSSNHSVAKISAPFTSAALSVIGRTILHASNTQDWTYETNGTPGMIGVEGSIRIDTGSSGTITRAVNFLAKGDGEIRDGGSITKLIQFYGQAYSGAGITAGKVANLYGIYLDAVTGGASSNYAIYSAGGSSYFEGNMGIATTTPNEKLTVWGGAFFGTTSATPTLYIASSTGRVAIGTSTASTLFTIATSTNIFNITTAGGVGVGTTTAGSAWFQVASTSPGLIIDRAGQVGIGTTTLSGLLTVGTSTTGLTVLQDGSVQIGTNGLTSAGTLWSTAFSSGTTAMLSLNNVNSVYTFTDDAESIANVISAYYAKTSSAYNGIAIGTVSRAILDPTNTQNWTAPQTRGGLVGLEGSARIGSNSTGTVSNVTTILAKGEGEINDGAAVTNWRQLLIETPTGAGVTAGNVANIYGLYMQSMTGAATSNYAIYSEGGSSYFAGNIGIATTTPNENLTVWGGAFFGTTSATPTLYIASSTGRVAIGTSTASSLFTIATSTNIFNITTAGGVGVGTTTAGSAWFQVASTSPGLIIDRAGQVGIGTTTLSGLFNVGTSTTGLTVLQNGNVGIGTIAPTSALDVFSTASPVMRGIRSTSDTVDMRNGAAIQHRTSGDMADGFGVLLEMQIRDDAGNDSPVGAIGAMRSGADNTGAIALYTHVAGALTERMRINNSGNVGIATTTPTEMLTIRASSTNPGLGVYASNSTPIIYTSSAGNVGIGTTGPTANFHIKNTADTSADTNLIRLESVFDTGGTKAIAWNDASAEVGRIGLKYDTVSQMDFVIEDLYNAGYQTATRLFTVKGSGNVGIGTTTPSETLTVWGGAFFGTTSATPTLYIASSTGRVAIGTSTASTLFSVATSTSIFHINQAGQVAVGTSTLSGLFSVATSTFGLFVNQAGQVGIGTTTIAGLLNVGTTTSSFFINQAGNIGIGTTTPNALTHIWGNAAVSALTVQQTGSGNIVDFMSTSTSIFTLASDDRLRYRDGLIQTWGDFQGVILDDFEDNVVTNWLSSDPANSTTSPSATTTHFKVGDYALGMHTTVNSSKGDQATSSPSTTDWSSYERLSYWIMVKNNSTSSLDASTTQQIIDFRFRDSGESAAFNATATIKEIGKWQYQEVDLNATGTTGRDVVSWYGFGITNDYGSPIFYIDQIRIYDSDERTSEVFVDSAGGLNIVSPTRIDLTRGAPGSDSRPGVSIDTAVVEINQPLSVNVGGDVGFDYDLVFMNTGMSNIISEGPLTISAGDNAHYENLTLKTGGTGDIVMDIASSTLGFKITGSATGTFGGYIMRVDPLGAAIEIGRGLVNDIVYFGGSLFPSTTTATTSNATTSAYSLGTSTSVWSAVWALTSHIGDLVFGNMFSITEASKIGIAPPEALVFQNASGTQIMKIDESGELTVDTIKTRQLCVGNTCVTEEQFSAVFGTSTATSSGEVSPPAGGESSTTTSTSTPETIIDSAIPANGESSTSTESSFAFHAEQNGTTTTDSTFQCKLGILDWAGCTSPKTYPGLSVGEYTFQVYAIDPLGNYDASPASSTWTIIE